MAIGPKFDPVVIFGHEQIFGTNLQDLEQYFNRVWIFIQKSVPMEKRSIKRILREQIIQETNEGKVPMGKEFGYHGGSLGGKSETPIGQPGIGDGSGMRHTGYYFFSDPERAAKRGHRGKDDGQFWAVDFSKYNLWKPSNSSAFFVSDKILNETLKLYSEKGEITDELERRLEENVKYHNRRLVVEILNNKENVEKAIENKDPLDIPRTAILKGLGYEGVDLRDIEILPGDADPDDSGIGSVIFDLKPGTIYGPFYGLEALEENDVKNAIEKLRTNIPLLKEFEKKPSIDDNPVDLTISWSKWEDVAYLDRFAITLKIRLMYEKDKKFGENEESINISAEANESFMSSREKERKNLEDITFEAKDELNEKIKENYKLSIDLTENEKEAFDRVNNVLSKLFEEFGLTS